MTHHPGEVVADAYVLLSPVHRGGMGEVWRAASLAGHEVVAVKFLGGDLPEADVARARLAREAENLAAVDSRHVIKLLDKGPDHLVMEYLEGESLAETLISRRKLPHAEVARFVGECADGLAAAHLAGVLHRDVKPANIILSPRGAVLADLGISHALGQDPITDPGRVMGTAEYLAPELMAGVPASPASDVYALGICAFEALTGAPPFRGTGPVETAAAQVDLPVPPLADDVPAFLRDLVSAMLAKDRATRPTALEVGAVARELLNTKTLNTKSSRARSGPDTLGEDGGVPRPGSQHDSEEDQW
ncbi:MAG: serine/threonine-protein kinase [Actinomycetota bacterium]